MRVLRSLRFVLSSPLIVLYDRLWSLLLNVQRSAFVKSFDTKCCHYPIHSPPSWPSCSSTNAFGRRRSRRSSTGESLSPYPAFSILAQPSTSSSYIVHSFFYLNAFTRLALRFRMRKSEDTGVGPVATRGAPFGMPRCILLPPRGFLGFEVTLFWRRGDTGLLVPPGACLWASSCCTCTMLLLLFLN